MTYEEAISLYKQGNESGFQYLYDTTYKTCLYVIGEIVKDREEAEDILQDAYMNAIQKIDTLKEPEKFPAWFRTIASHLAINQANKNKKSKTVNPIEDESPEAVMDRIINEKAANNQITPEEAYECRETSMLLHELIDDLPEKQRQCIILFYMEDYSIKDIAEACNCKENTVKSRLNYGKKKLEEKAIEMQNKGYVLRGVAPVYLITWLLKADMANKIKFVYSNVSTGDFSHALFSNIVKSGLITTVNSGITTATGNAVSGSVIVGNAAKGVASATVKGGIHTIGGKIVTGAVVAAIAGGLVTAAVVTNNNKTEDEPTTELTEAVSEESVSTEDIDIAAETTSEEVTTEEEATEEVISNNTVTGSLEDKDIFGSLPSKFTFSSGVGGWATFLYINPDGSFTGQYCDYDLGVSEAFICNFNGKFSSSEKINDYTYSTHLEYLKYEETEGTVYYEDGIKYTVLEYAYGLDNVVDNADEFYIYLPGTPVSELSEDFLSWVSVDTDTLPANFYGLYGIDGGTGFYGLSDDCLWDKDYIYTYGNYTSSINTWISSGDITFYSEDGTQAIWLYLTWESEDQTEFDSTNWSESCNYHISLDVSDDYTAITATITSENKTDLSAWGGTTDGKIVITYTLK